MPTQYEKLFAAWLRSMKSCSPLTSQLPSRAPAADKTLSRIRGILWTASYALYSETGWPVSGDHSPHSESKMAL
jgi:hypothetical protein